MTDDPGCFSESPQKGHQQDYGRNQLGIIVFTLQQGRRCRRCDGDIFIGQRVMKDPNARSWPHLECAKLEWFSRIDDDSCTEPAVARPDTEKLCAWCTEEIVADEDKWKACWMGWVHAECDPGNKCDFVEILRRLQHRHPGRSMPQQCHHWETLEELKTYSLLGHYVEQPPYEAADSSWTQQARAVQRKQALATMDLGSAFSSNGVPRRLLFGEAPDAASDAPSAPEDSSDSDSSAQSLPASDVDTDDELLETRGFRLFRLRISEQNHKHAAKYPRRRIHKQGPQRRLIHPGTEGNELDREIVLPCFRSHRARPNTGRTEALGDEDTSSGGDESDVSDSFIVPDSSCDDDSSDYSAITDSESSADGSGGRDGADSAPGQNMQQPQLGTTSVLSVDASADDDQADCESVTSAESDVRVNSARRCRRKAVLPLGVIDLTESGDEAQPTGPPTPAQTAQKLLGCKRL